MQRPQLFESAEEEANRALQLTCLHVECWSWSQAVATAAARTALEYWLAAVYGVLQSWTQLK